MGVPEPRVGGGGSSYSGPLPPRLALLDQSLPYYDLLTCQLQDEMAGAYGTQSWVNTFTPKSTNPCSTLPYLDRASHGTSIDWVLLLMPFPSLRERLPVCPHSQWPGASVLPRAPHFGK